MFSLLNFCMHSRGSAIKFLGTKRHHDKWLVATENYDIMGCFAMTELGHGSNVRAEIWAKHLYYGIISVTVLIKFCCCFFITKGARNRDNSNL
jgi:hypothetical protein